MASEIKRPKRLRAVLGLLLVLSIVAAFTATARATGVSAKRSQAAAMTVEIATLKARASAANSSWLIAQRKLEAVRKAVKSSSQELTKARDRYQGAREVVAQRAAAMYKQRDLTLVDVLMRSGSFGEMVSQVRLFACMADYDRDVLADLRQTKADVESKHQELVAAREAARLLVLQRKQESAYTQFALSTQQQQLAGLQSEIKEMQASLRQPSPTASPLQADTGTATSQVTTPATSSSPSGGWWPAIRAAASANGISAAGLYKLMMIESGGIQTIVGGGQFCGLFQYWPPAWKASWNPYRAANIFDGAAQIKATALAIGMGKGPSWWPNSYQHAFGGI
jgi:peptidoglycan hydrolase CwlO-like protein